jgi:hypothetical protein
LNQDLLTQLRERRYVIAGGQGSSAIGGSVISGTVIVAGRDVIIHEQKVNHLSGRELLAQQIAQQLSPQIEEMIKALFLQNSSLEDTRSEKLSQERTYDAQIDQARDLIQEDKAGAAQSLLKEARGRISRS